jgi:PAS domain S-box-containing protein
MEERAVKETLLEYTERMLNLYKGVIIPAALIFALFILFIPPVFKTPIYPPLLYFILFLVLFSFLFTFFIYTGIKRKIRELAFEKIQKILVLSHLLEISSISLSLWFFLSFSNGLSFFFLLPFLIVFFFSLPGYFSQRWLNFFTFYLLFLFISFFLAGIFNFYPFPLPTSPLKYLTSAWVYFFFSLIMIFVVYNLMVNIWRREYLLRRELERTRKEIERKIQERTKKLQEMFEEAQILRIRERARMVDIERKSEELERTRTALMNILEDVEEERKKTEEEKNKTLAVIINFVDGLLVFDKEGRVSLINPQAENFCKLKGKEVIGKSILELSQFPDFKPIVEAVGKEMKGIFRKEVPIREDLILEVTTAPIMREEEKIGTLMILHDVTREKMIERMKTEFVSISAHQLRTPLSAIKWTLKMFLDGDLGELTKEQREFLEKTYKSNERMINLINDLLNVARIEEGRYLYRPVLADIVPICQSVIDSCKEEIEKKKLKFRFEKPKGLPKVRVDVEKISLAIQNLLENAIRYNREGGGIEITLEEKEGKIKFSIKDTGIGIPKDQQHRVFTKFFRAPNAMRMETEGSGLGLFITKNIIEAHGGEIWFESEEGKGTTFYFTLPVASYTKG